MKFWTTIAVLLFYVTGFCVTLEDSGVDYGDDIRIDRVNAVPTHAADGRYILIDTEGGAIINAVPTPGEDLLSIRSAQTPIVSVEDTGDIETSGTLTVGAGVGGDAWKSLYFDTDSYYIRWVPVNSSFLFSHGVQTGSGVFTGSGAGLTNVPTLKLTSMSRVLVVSMDGNDTTAATGVGPFADIDAAMLYAQNTLSPVASTTNPVVILLKPGTYTDGNSADISDGIHIVGTSREACVWSNPGQQMISPSVTANATWSVSNLTIKVTSPGASGGGFDYGGDLCGYSSNGYWNDVSFLSEALFEEYPDNVAMFRIFPSVTGQIALTFRNCFYDGLSMFLMGGHPSVGGRAAVLDVTMENCCLESRPNDDGPEDPHFFIWDMLPGSLTLRGCDLLWDMDASTRTWAGGVLLVSNEDGNDFPSDGFQKINILNSRLEYRSNGLSADPDTVIQINAKSGSNRSTTYLDGVTFVRDAEVDADLVTSNESTVYYRGSNLELHTSSGGAATVTPLIEGIKKVSRLYVGDDDSTDDYLHLGAASIYWDEAGSRIATNAKILSSNTGANSLAGSLTLKLGLTCGVTDNTRGTLLLLGHDTGTYWGGYGEFYTAADYDSTINCYRVGAYQAGLTIGPDTDTDMLELNASGLILRAGSLYIGLDDSTDDILTLGGGYWKWDETYSQLVTASPVYLGSNASIGGNLTVASNKQVKQAQNGDTGPFMVSGMLGDPVSPGPPSFNTSVLGYSPGSGTTTSLFKLREIPFTVHNSTVYIDAITVVCEGLDAGDYMDQVRILTYDDSSGYTVVASYTTDFGAEGITSQNILSSDISRSTYQKAFYIEFTMVEDTVFYLYDVVIQYHLE